jgi:hypothetical protein
MTRLLLLALLMLGALGCEGLIGRVSGDDPPPGDPMMEPPLDPTGPPPELTCVPSQFTGLRLEAIVEAYTRDVHPVVLSAERGCVSCHAAGSGRMFLVSTDATETFYRLRGGEWFKDKPGNFVSRLVNPDARTRMPLGLPSWSKGQIEAVVKVGCMLEAFEQGGGPAADEQFPPELLMPWDGGANPDYDNAFLNFPQLKAKVAAVFNDDWRRAAALPDGGSGAMEDRFDKNIGLFGGVNFRTHFVEARAATPEFLLGLDQLAPDVCGRASAQRTGPFQGVDTAAPIIDVPAEATTAFEVESATIGNRMNVGSATTNPAGFFCYTNCDITVDFDALAPGDYRVTVRAKADNDDAGNGPKVGVRVGSVAAMPLTFTDQTQYVEQSVTVRVTSAGRQVVTVAYINDYDNPPPAGGDRNIAFDRFTVTGPLGAGTGTARATTAKGAIDTLMQRLVFRPASAADQTQLYALLRDLTVLGGTQPEAWSGVCEALMRHPDFLFTVPPSYADTTGPARQRLIAVGLAQHLVGRPPTAAEFMTLSTQGYPALVDALLASPDFERYYFSRVQLRIESQGTPDSDEPARLWTHVVVNRLPFARILDADFSVDTTGAQRSRPAEHGKTGVLTMKGYVSNKPGLPHYNYPARVFSGFMGTVFEVPPEVFDQRGTATATSTVDPSSLCFTCHQLLTPLAYQRLKWADDGTYRTVDEQGQAIDDSDHALVPTYPYKGQGLEAFSTKAVKKEAFVRRMLAMQFRLLMGREMRYRDDEREVYRQLWDVAATRQGDLKAVIKAVATSPTFTRGTP